MKRQGPSAAWESLTGRCVWTLQRTFNEDMRERTSNTLTRLDRMEGDSGTLKGYWARNTAVSDAAGIAQDMGLEFVRTLTPAT